MRWRRHRSFACRKHALCGEPRRAQTKASPGIRRRASLRDEKPVSTNVGDEGFVEICGSAEKTWNDTLDIMGWKIEPSGLGVVLNRAIPTFAKQNMLAAMEEMLGPQGIALGDIDRFVCHPGGAKVVDAIETALSLNQGSLDLEREVLRDHGNMSAPTALFVLDRLRRLEIPPLSVLTALGPGFTASTVTLRRAA